MPHFSDGGISPPLYSLELALVHTSTKWKSRDTNGDLWVVCAAFLPLPTAGVILPLDTMFAGESGPQIAQAAQDWVNYERFFRLL